MTTRSHETQLDQGLGFARVGLCRLILLLLVSAAHVSSAQPPRQAAQGVVPKQCADCSVQLRRLYTFGGLDSPLLRLPRAAVEGPSGELILLQGSADPLLVIDRTGKLRTTIGGPGQGPGETEPARALEADRSGVRVYSAGRVTEFSPALRYVRVFREADPQRFVDRVLRLEDGSTASLTNPMGPVTEGPPPLLLAFRDTAGKKTCEMELRQAVPNAGGRVLGPASKSHGGGLWMAVSPALHGTGYVISRLNGCGNPRELFRREGLDYWIARREGWEGFIMDTLPSPNTHVSHIKETSNGLLHVLITVPRLPWKAIKQADRYNDHHFTVLEVLDPRSGSLIGTARVPGFPAGLLDGAVLTYRESEGGEPFLSVWQVLISRP